MCEQGGGGLSVCVMEELLLFPAKSEEQRRKDRRVEEVRQNGTSGGESLLLTHMHMSTISSGSPPPLPTTATWAFRWIHNMEVLRSDEPRAAERLVGGGAPTEEQSFSRDAALSAHHKEPSSYLSISAFRGRQNETVR